MISPAASRFVSLLLAVLLVTAIITPIQASIGASTPPVEDHNRTQAENNTFVGGLVRVDGSLAEGVEVTSDQGVSDTTDDGGKYELSVPAVEQNLTADAFGYATETKRVTPEINDSVTIVPFSLDEQIIEAETITAPEYVPAGETVRITHRVAHANVTTVSIANSTRTTPSNASLQINGFNASFGEQVFIGDNDTVTVTIRTDERQFSRFELEHTFSDSFAGNRTTSTTTGPTTVHPETVTVPDDVEPGHPDDSPYTELQNLLEFVVDGTTVELNHSTFAAEPTIPVGSNFDAAIALNTSVTLTAAPNATPAIALRNASTTGSSTAGIVTNADNVTVSGIELRGNGAETSVLTDGLGATVTNNTFRNTTTGAMNLGDNLTLEANRFRNHTTGVSVQNGSVSSIAGNSFIHSSGDNDSEEMGVVVGSGVVERIENNTIRGSDTGIHLSESPETVDTTIRDNEITNTSGAGIIISQSTNQTLEKNRIIRTGTAGRLTESNQTQLSTTTGAQAGIVLDNASDTHGAHNSVHNAATGITVTNASHNTALIDSTFENVSRAIEFRNNTTATTFDTVTITNPDGTIGFGDVDDTNAVTDATLAGTAPLTVSGTNATLALNQSPPDAALLSPGPTLELRPAGNNSSLSTAVAYTDSAVTAIDETTLRLYTYDETWSPAAGSTVDTDAQVVSGTITEPGPFAPFGEKNDTDGGSTGDEDDGSNDDGGGGSDDDGRSGGGGGRPLPPRDDDDDDEDDDETTSPPDTPTGVPTAVIDTIPETVTVGQEVTFSATNSTVDGSIIGSYDWTIGGVPFEGDTVTTAFYSAGEIEIELTVIAVNNERNTTTTTLTVEPEPGAGGDIGDDERGDSDEETGDSTGSGGSSIPGFGVVVALVGLFLGVDFRRRS